MSSRRRKVRVVRAIDPPLGLGRDYARAIRSMEALVFEHLDRHVFPAYAQGVRRDELPQGVIAGMLSLSPALATAFSDTRIRTMALSVAQRVDARHRGEFYRRAGSALGVDVLVSEGFRDRMVGQWVDENTALIKSIRDTVGAGVNADLERAFAAGVRHEVVRRQWEDRGLPLEFGTLRGRAKVIARDQANKLNGQLNEARQRALGVTHYIWQTVRDERVRGAHAARQGRRYAWDKPPQDGHPGQPVQCRCSAAAVLDLDEVLAQPGVVSLPRRQATSLVPAAAALIAATLVTGQPSGG